MPRSSSCPTRGCRSWSRGETSAAHQRWYSGPRHGTQSSAILMPIDLVAVAITLILGLAIGCLVGWLASRPGVSRLQSALEKDRAVHAERLKAYGEAQTNFREAFQALSADALKTN